MKRFRRILPWTMGAIFVALIVLVAPNMKTAVSSYLRNACCGNLICIDGAKEQAALMLGTKRGDTISVEAFLPYLKGRSLPTCPTGGKYRIGVYGELPRCDRHGRFNQEWLHLTAFHGDTNLLAKLLTDGFSVNHNDEEKWTPLHWAAYGGRSEMVCFLIGKGASVNVRTAMGQTAMDLASDTNTAALLRVPGK